MSARTVIVLVDIFCNYLQEENKGDGKYFIKTEDKGEKEWIENLLIL